MDVSYGLFSAHASGGSSIHDESAEGSESAKTEVEKFTLSFESLISPIKSGMWDSVRKFLGSTGWYLDGVAPGSFFKNDNVRFVVEEAVFVQKFAFYSSHDSVQSAMESKMTNNTSSWNASGGVSYGGLGGVSASHSQSDSHSKQSNKSNAEVDSETKTIAAGNVNLKFVLLRPIMPAPLRGGETPQQKTMKDSDCWRQLNKSLNILGGNMNSPVFNFGAQKLEL